jgi:hypothetical protein
MSFGGTALAYNPADNGLFIVGYGNYAAQPIAEISIPSTIVNSSNLDALSTDTILQRWTPVLPNLPTKLTGASDGAYIGGLMVYNGELIGTDYAYYSGANAQVLSHFVLSSTNLATATVGGLYQVGNGGRILAGYMTPIPGQWQAALGGYTALAALSNEPIINSESSGPGAFGFNPGSLGSPNATDAPFLDYPVNNPLGNYFGPADPLQNGNTTISGDVFVPGTSSILYFGSAATSFSGYGNGGPYGDNMHGGKGPHSLNGQYSFQAWAYDANDLAAVYQGKMQPWQVMPYDTWNFTLPIPGTYEPGGVTFDPSTGRVYLSLLNADKEAPQSDLPLIEVFQINVPAATSSSAPAIGTLTGDPIITPMPNAVDPSGAQVPQSVGTYAGPVVPGDAVLLTAGNVYAAFGGASVSSVSFYLDTNNDGVLDNGDQLLGKGTPDMIDANATTNFQLTISTSGMAAGTHTIFAQAETTNGLLSVPISMQLVIA